MSFETASFSLLIIAAGAVIGLPMWGEQAQAAADEAHAAAVVEVRETLEAAASGEAGDDLQGALTAAAEEVADAHAPVEVTATVGDFGVDVRTEANGFGPTRGLVEERVGLLPVAESDFGAEPPSDEPSDARRGAGPVDVEELSSDELRKLVDDALGELDERRR